MPSGKTGYRETSLPLSFLTFRDIISCLNTCQKQGKAVNLSIPAFWRQAFLTFHLLLLSSHL
ncbi:hypothetical protein A3860_03245 [Niastella vici]|uniref:Uncharacterized protein n=1 Tax=Niastella vici TaxID=1703345 RepID=A0A1V9G9Z6_9BACT|nr:hypothetical protein A3860_03245 [Niastella vici]